MPCRKSGIVVLDVGIVAAKYETNFAVDFTVQSHGSQLPKRGKHVPNICPYTWRRPNL
jgi:hypothetical protein